MSMFLERAPDACLRKAERLAKQWHEYPSTEHEDPIVTVYAQFLNGLSKLPVPAKERYLRLNPIPAEIHFLVGGGSLDDTLPCVPEETAAAQRDSAIVKAMILCDVDPETISSYLGLKVKSIQGFEYLAFNVRSRLTERAYIHNYVLSDTVLGSPSSTDFEQMILIEAYHNGFDGLKRYLHLDVEEDPDFIEQMSKEQERELQVKAKTAIRSTPVNSYTSMEFLNQVNTRSKLKIEEKTATGLSDNSGASLHIEDQSNILALISGVGLQVAPSALESDEKRFPRIEERMSKKMEKAIEEVLAQSESE